MRSYGVFLNIITNNRDVIKKQITFLQQLNNLKHIEVWLECANWSLEDTKWLKKQLMIYDIIVHAPFISFSFVAEHKFINEASLKALQSFIKHIEILNGQVMTIHIGRKPLYLTDKEARETAIPYLKKLVDFIDGKFDLAIENLPISTGTSLRYPTTLNELDVIIQKISKLQSTVDIGHCLQNNDDYKKYFKKNINKICNIHVHNAIINDKAHFGFNKKGNLDLREFVKYLNSLNYTNYFTFEIIGNEDIIKSWNLLQNFIN